MYKLIKLIIMAVWAMAPLQGMAWGDTGHNVTAEIARRHLTDATRHAVDSILDGRTIVYWAKWLDFASHTPEYAYTKTWHYRDVDADKNYFTQPDNPEGDAVKALRDQIAILSDSITAQEEKALALKILVHVMADIHQPLHMGHLTDLGGNTVKIKYRGRDTNLHSFWDTGLPDAMHKWSYTEWADQLDRLRPQDEIFLISGNIDDWGMQTVELAGEIYEKFPAGIDVGNELVMEYMPVVDDQFLKGGHRLAHVLNTIFDPAYSRRPSFPF